MLIRFLFLLSLLLCFNMTGLYAQDHLIHKPWKLEGANKRIDSIRKGSTTIQFIFPDMRQNPSKATASFELVNHDFNFGVSLTQMGPFSTQYQEMYKSRVKELFNFVTLGFYWAGRDETNDLTGYKRQMRAKVDWAVENNIKIKGHPLLWHESLPKWVIDHKEPAKLEKIIYKRIEDLIQGYPEIEYWDVYNEAIAPFKDHVTPSGVTRWITYKGGIYPAMKTLYDFVNEIDATKIYTNNHYHPTDPEFLKLNTFFIEQNVGYHAIGMQAHMQTHDNVFSEDELWNLVNTFTPLGKKIQFTEVTVTSSKLFNNWKDHQVFLEKRKKSQEKGKTLNLPSLAEKEIYQAAYLKDFYTLLFSHPNVSSITMWNLTDKNAWRGHAGGILDMELQPKKAFYALKKLIKDTWTTRVDATFNFNEEMAFSGFYGTYEGHVNVNGVSYPFRFEHKKETDKPIHITLQH